MNKTHFGLRAGLALILILVVAAAAPGGFEVSVEIPSSTLSLKNAQLIVRAVGCHEPAKADISATAEGVVNGKRQSIRLKMHPVSDGVYAIERQWPSSGAWAIAITGSYRGQVRSALVQVGADGAVATKTVRGGRSELELVKVRGKMPKATIESALASADPIVKSGISAR